MSKDIIENMRKEQDIIKKKTKYFWKKILEMKKSFKIENSMDRLNHRWAQLKSGKLEYSYTEYITER